MMQQVALMFVGAMSGEHASLWDEWLAPIADKAPASVLCNEQARACYWESRQNNIGISAYERQVLFSFVIDASHSGTPEAGALQGAIFTNCRQVQFLWPICEPPSSECSHNYRHVLGSPENLQMMPVTPQASDAPAHADRITPAQAGRARG